MSIKTNELQQITAPQGSDSLLLDTAAAGTGQLTMAQAAAFFGAELVKPTNPVGASLSQKADAGVPEQISLPISEGWSNHSGVQCFWYRKSPNGLVTLYVDIYRSDDITGVQDLGTLPEGFRPEVRITFIGIADNTAIPIAVTVKPTGQIVALPVRANGNPATETQFRYVFGTGSFYAAD